MGELQIEVFCVTMPLRSRLLMIVSRSSLTTSNDQNEKTRTKDGQYYFLHLLLPRKKKKRKSSGWLLFVDFSKAYDSIDRDALLLILRKLKFEKNIIGFVKTSLKPYKVFSESLGVDIQVERGVPQG